MRYSSQENSSVVLQRKHLSGVEVDGLVTLDTRKAFVPSSSHMTPSDLILSYSWLGEKCYLVREL